MIVFCTASQNPNQLASNNNLLEPRKPVSLTLAVPRLSRDNEMGWSKKANLFCVPKTSLLPNESRSVQVGVVQKGKEEKGREGKARQGQARQGNKGEYSKSIRPL